MMSISDSFHIFYEEQRLWENNTWLGIPMWKLPMDAFVIQEIIYKTQPEFIIETGTGRGGSSVFYASILELMNLPGKVITIDIEQQFDVSLIKNPTLKNRIITILGGSTNPLIFKKVCNYVGGSTAMVLLDSWHTYKHVFNEMLMYSQFVQKGFYLIVEDSHVSKEGNPVKWKYDDEGPKKAIDEFLKQNNDFEVDYYNCEKHLMTFNPGGFLKKVR